MKNINISDYRNRSLTTIVIFSTTIRVAKEDLSGMSMLPRHRKKFIHVKNSEA